MRPGGIKRGPMNRGLLLKRTHVDRQAFARVLVIRVLTITYIGL